jgi:predicted dienelactone hydrolase
MADAANAGYRALEAMDRVQGARVPVHVLYPTGADAVTERFGPYSIEAARDAPVGGERLPLVAVSHGSHGTPWAHRGLAALLARSGFAVVLVEHPGDSRADHSLAGTPANLANRPRHLRLAIDAVLADGVIGPWVVPEVTVVGHSAGGYTALALAGGRPISLPHESADGVAREVPVERDPRVRALVLLAPALPWFMGPGALADVRAPLLVRTAELDELAPPAFVEGVLRGLSAGVAIDLQVVAGAGHFAFQSPFPAALAGPAFPPSQDSPGFDRAAYQARLGAEVVAFLRAARPA